VTALAETFRSLGFRPSKGRGQNFLVQPALARRMVASVTRPFSTAFEIGPGLGALTGEILSTAARVVAVEIDSRLCEYLRLTYSDRPGFQLIHSDALRVDWAELLDRTPAPRALFGNLPYSVSASLLEKLFQHSGLFSEAVVCLQSEVAERLISQGGRSMGPITLLAGRFCDLRTKLFRLSAGVFFPRPDVTSMAVRLALRPGVTWSVQDREIPRRLFRHRRKVLASTIPSDLLRELHRETSSDWSRLRIDQLALDEACLLADRLRIES